jgi:hypothetical protein
MREKKGFKKYKISLWASRREEQPTAKIFQNQRDRLKNKKKKKQILDITRLYKHLNERVVRLIDLIRVHILIFLFSLINQSIVCIWIILERERERERENTYSLQQVSLF